MRQTMDTRCLAYTREALSTRRYDVWFTREEQVRSTEIIICGQFPSLAITFKRSIVSALPTTSSNVCGLYFSTLNKDEGCFVPNM